MAYLDIRDTIPAGAAIQSAARAETTVARFSALEWLVIALAERDRRSSLATPGRIAVALHRLFGGGTQGRLANPRLEALRRFAVMAWHGGGSVAPSDRAAFEQAGFTTAQGDALLDSIFARRGPRRVGAAA